jgi:hypothetical protein
MARSFSAAKAPGEFTAIQKQLLPHALHPLLTPPPPRPPTTMGDAVDILNLERPNKPALHRILHGSALNAGCAKKVPSKSDAKHASLHREMRLLSGSAGFHAEELTTLVPTETLSFKQSRRRDGTSGKWLWQKFTNSARSDQLELFHWQKSTVVLDDYHFAKFNKSLGARDFVM